MSKIDQQFAELRSANRKALIPFVTAGDPDVAFTTAVVNEFAARGCSICEIGVPYSDPIADGPVIQASYTRALNKGVTLESILSEVGTVSGQIEMPLVTMVSYAIVLRRGLERYVAEAKAAGIAGAIVPDLLVEEADKLADICRREDFSLIQLVTPTTPRERAVRIAATSSGFLYYVSVTGITGERKELPPELMDNVSWLREQSDLPVCIGFGISHEDQVRQLREVADGVIVGSAFVRRVSTLEDRPRKDVINDMGEFASRLLGALHD